MKKRAPIIVIFLLAICAVGFALAFFTNDAEKNSQIGTLNAEIAERNSQIDALNANIADKSGQIKALNMEATDRRGKLEALTEEAAKKDEQIEALTAVAEGVDDRIEALNAEVAARDQRIETLTAQAQAKDGRIETLTAEAQAKDSKIETLTAEAEEKDRQIETLTSEAAERDQQSDAQDTEKDELIEALTAEVAEQEAQLDALTKSNDALTKSNEALQAGRDDAQQVDEAEIARLQYDLDAANAELAEKQDALEQSEAEARSLRSNISGIWSKQGYEAYRQGDFSRAGGYFSSALAYSPDSYDYASSAAMSYIAAGDRERGTEMLKACIELNPDAVEPYIYLKNLYEGIAVPDDVMALLEEGYSRTGDARIIAEPAAEMEEEASEAGDAEFSQAEDAGTEAPEAVGTRISADELREVQGMLIDIGLLPEGADDGDYDVETVEAVLAFQQWVNLQRGEPTLPENGEIDELTRAYLDYCQTNGLKPDI